MTLLFTTFLLAFVTGILVVVGICNLSGLSVEQKKCSVDTDCKGLPETNFKCLAGVCMLETQKSCSKDTDCKGTNMECVNNLCQAQTQETGGGAWSGK